jgi:hypothetical protein
LLLRADVASPRLRCALPTISLVAALACAVPSKNYADLVVKTEAGAETIVPGGLELVEEATRQAFQFLEVRRTSYRVDSGSEARHMVGRVANRDGDVWVTLRTTKAGNVHVAVRARSRIADPDYDFASLLTAKIIETVDRLSEGPQAARGAGVRLVSLVTLSCDRRGD